jgi:cytochrome c-type biogenesis protein CcmH/NrfG
VSSTPQRGLPPRVYLPIVIAIGGIFVAAVSWLVHQGFATGGSVFGNGTGSPARAGAAATAAPPAVNVEGGGPPATVRVQLAQLRDRIARNPKDDVALTQLADMYLAVGKYAQALPFYRRALSVNPKNVAAQEGLSEAQAGLKGAQ